MKNETIKQICLDPGINGYKVNVRIEWYDNEYFFATFEKAVEFIKELDLPLKEIMKGQDDVANAVVETISL